MGHIFARYFRRFLASPWRVPGAIGLLASLLELGGEGARFALRYDRAGIEAGELWRLATGHLVHLGPSHMLMDVAALAVLALILTPSLPARHWLGVSLTGALAIDAGLWFVHPEVTWYVGLSGLLHGYWAAGCLRALLDRQLEAIPLALLLLLKLGYEGLIGPVPMTAQMAAGHVVTEAHLWGAVGGVLWMPIAMALRRRPL